MGSSEQSCLANTQLMATFGRPGVTRSIHSKFELYIGIVDSANNIHRNKGQPVIVATYQAPNLTLVQKYRRI